MEPVKEPMKEPVKEPMKEPVMEPMKEPTLVPSEPVPKAQLLYIYRYSQ